MHRTALVLSFSALLFACSSTPAAPGADSGITPDAGTDDAAPDCGPLSGIPANSPTCPATYTHADGGCGSPCTVATTCSYPGAGDGISPGCNATAVMWCHASSAADAGDAAAADSFWTCAQ